MGNQRGLERPAPEIPPPPTHVSLEGPELPSGSKRTRRHHRTNLLSGWHKGKVRGQISAMTWKCFLMVMSSYTCLHPSRRNAGPRRVTVVRCESQVFGGNILG